MCPPTRGKCQPSTVRSSIFEPADPLYILVENPGIERATKTATEQLVLSLVERLVSCLLVWLVSCWISGGILIFFVVLRAERSL